MPSLNSKKEKKSNKEKKSSSVSQIKVHVYDIPPQTTLQQMKTVLESLNLNSPDDYEILYYLQGSLVYVCLLPSQSSFIIYRKSSTSSLYLTCQTEKKAIKLIDTLNKYKIDNNSSMFTSSLNGLMALMHRYDSYRRDCFLSVNLPLQARVFQEVGGTR